MTSDSISSSAIFSSTIFNSIRRCFDNHLLLFFLCLTLTSLTISSSFAQSNDRQSATIVRPNYLNPINEGELRFSEIAYLEQRVADLERAVWQLKQRYDSLKKNSNRFVNPKLNDSPDMFIKITQMEEFIRKLVGENQLLNHEIGRLNERLEKMQRDTDFRFKTLASNNSQVGLAPSDRDSIGPIIRQNQSPTEQQPQDDEITYLKRTDPEEVYKLFSAHLDEQLYESAEEIANDFIKYFPKHNLASIALYELGEGYFEKQNYRKAAASYLRVYIDYGEQKNAPQSVYKLALSLIQLNEKQQACAALYAIGDKYPDVDPQLKNQVEKDISRYNC